MDRARWIGRVLVGCLAALYLMGPALRLLALTLSAAVSRRKNSTPPRLAHVAHSLESTADEVDAFMAKGTNPIRVKLQVEGIVAAEQGGTCETECEDAHGKIVALDDEWKQYSVAFDEVFQEGWGASVAFDPATMMGIQFQIAASTDFDVTVDEVGFY